MSIPNKLFLFNLCETSDISVRTILKVYNGAKLDQINPEIIKTCLGDTKFANDVIDSLDSITENELSLYALAIVGINTTVIEALRSNFKSISDLYDNKDELQSLNFQVRTLEKVNTFFDNAAISSQLTKIIKLDETEHLLKELRKLHSPITINDFYILIGSKYGFSSIDSFTEAINTLAKKSKIKITGNGISIKRDHLGTYLVNNHSERDVEMLEYYLQGTTLEQTARKYGLSKQRINQLLNRRISKLPEFEHEKDIYATMSVYQLSKETSDELFVEEPLVPYYVKAKYKLNPEKTEIDYVIEKNLLDTSEGLRILKRNGYIFIQDKLYKINFAVLFKKYLTDNNILIFKGNDIKEPFTHYLKDLKIDLDSEILKGISFNVKLSHLNYLLNYGSQNYYYFESERYDELFLTKARDYLENFYGYGYVDYFYNANTSLCLKNQIYNASQLFVVLKTLFERDFIEDIEFIRNPSICTKGLDKEQFFIELIEELQPIKVDDFLEKLDSQYGIKKSNVLFNYSNLLQKFKTEDGYLSTNIEAIDENNEIIRAIRTFLGKEKIVSLKNFTKHFTQECSKKEFAKYSSKYFIKRLGYKVTNFAIYSPNYNSSFDAMVNLCDNLPVVVAESEIQKYYPVNQLDNRYDSVKEKCLLLRYSNESFLNVGKMIDRNTIIDFRTKLIALLTENVIYTLGELKQLFSFNQLLEQFSEVKEILLSLGPELLTSILQSSSDITYLDTDVFVFGKGEKITQRGIIRSIIDKEDFIDRYELLDILSSTYGIELNNPSASFFAEMGFFFSTINNKVYKSKELYNDELRQYLDSEKE